MTTPLDLPLYLRIGKTNMAAEAFRAVRLENSPTTTAAATDPKTGPHNETTALIGEPSLGFGDLLDALNPLQHLPIIASVYRSLTDDEIAPLARLAGGALYGGPIGLAVSLGDAILEQVSGDDLGGHVMTALFPSDAPSQQTAAIPSAAAIKHAPNPVAPPAPKPLAAIEPPSLSPEMVNALFASFKDPDTPGQPDAAGQKEQTPESIARREPPRDLLGALHQSLDKYEALHGQTLALDTTARLP